MTILAPRSAPTGWPDQLPAGAARPLLRAVSSADDGYEGTRRGSTPVEGFVVEWQLAVVAGAAQ